MRMAKRRTIPPSAAAGTVTAWTCRELNMDFDNVPIGFLEPGIKRDDYLALNPNGLMPTIKDLLQTDDAPRKTMFSIVESATVDALAKATEEVLGDLGEEGKGILAVMELSKVLGFRGP